jgi:hypothetical protein
VRLVLSMAVPRLDVIDVGGVLRVHDKDQFGEKSTLPDWRLSCQGCRLVLSSTRDTQIVADRVEVEMCYEAP